MRIEESFSEGASGSEKFRGHVDRYSHQVVSGWAFDPDHPERAVSVEIFVNGFSVGFAVAEIYREDLKNLAPNATGKYGFEYHFTAILSLFSEQNVTVANAEDHGVLSNGEKKLLPLGATAKDTGKAMPLLVTALGRSGTTLLMKHLSLHPEIAVSGPFPYEIKMMSYYALAFRTLVLEANHLQSTNPIQMALAPNQYFIGFNPYNRPSHQDDVEPDGVPEFFRSGTPKILGETFRHMTMEYYERVRVSLGKVRMRYMAEKTVLDETARLAPRCFFGDAREIVLIRDPRDLVCSFGSFWQTEWDEAVASIEGSMEAVKSIQLEKRSDTLIVKFEDLILASDETRTRIFDFLELKGTRAILPEEEASMFRVHGTSASPEASIGRWKTDLSHAQLAKCTAVFEPYLKFFHYQ